MLKLILISFLFTSCATAKDWGDWIEKPIQLNMMVWEWCDKRFHGPDYHNVGMCYIAKECRERKTIFGNKKEECRSHTLVCKWGDIECMREYKIDEKKIR